MNLHDQLQSIIDGVSNLEGGNYPSNGLNGTTTTTTSSINKGGGNSNTIIPSSISRVSTAVQSTTNVLPTPTMTTLPTQLPQVNNPPVTTVATPTITPANYDLNPYSNSVGLPQNPPVVQNPIPSSSPPTIQQNQQPQQQNKKKKGGLITKLGLGILIIIVAIVIYLFYSFFKKAIAKYKNQAKEEEEDDDLTLMGMGGGGGGHHQPNSTSSSLSNNNNRKGTPTTTITNNNNISNRNDNNNNTWIPPNYRMYGPDVNRPIPPHMKVTRHPNDGNITYPPMQYDSNVPLQQQQPPIQKPISSEVSNPPVQNQPPPPSPSSKTQPHEN